MESPFYYLPEIIKEPVYAVPSLEGLQIEIAFNKENEIGRLFKRSLHATLSFIDTVQAKNAALASVVVKFLIPSILEETIEQGLKKAWLPARFEVFSKEPLIILDGAHTEKSIEYCIETYRKIKNEKALILFACADDKDTKLIAPIFKEVAKEIYITIPGSFKKSNLEKVRKDFVSLYENTNIPCHVSPDYENVIKTAFDVSRKNNFPLLITGSFYLVAEAKKIISH